MTDPGGETQISGAVAAVPAAPRYEDEDAEALGEKLAELYSRRDRNPRAKVEDAIESTRRELRRGPRLRAGEFLKDGRYRLIERIGDSAGDTTWRAWDRLGQRLVVIKEMVGPWVAKKMRVGTFLEAARTLQGIEHAGLARILEATQSRDGFVYLATDHFEAGTLSQGFAGDQVDVLQVIVEVGNALQAAHERELIHARVQPSNIHFDAQGGAHLTDFDLAGEHAQEERGSVYAAPETVERGNRGTPASDVYSLAMCALFALNHGKLPYTVVRGPDRFIDQLEIAATVKAVLKRAVDWDLEQRFGSMRAFVDALLADPDVLEMLAARALERGRRVIASEHYTALWSARPERSVEIKRILGNIYLGMEAWEEAYTCLATALEEADDPEPMYEPLRAYASGTGNWKRVADLLWNQARARKPIQRASMRAELARITEQHLADAQAATEMWTLVYQDHRLPARGRQALEALARLAESRGDWAKMVEHDQALLPYLPEDARADVQYAIGRALLKHLGDEEGGLKWIDLAEAGGVKPLDMVTELQDTRARRGQWRRVIGLMRLEADHEDKVHAASRVLLRAATIARSVHLDAEAEGIYENLLERAPQHFPALRALARMRDCDGRSAAAMEAYEKLSATYEGKSEEPEASERAADHAAYARLLIQVGRFEEASRQLEGALALQPDNIEALRLAAPLCLDLGRVEDGANALERLYAMFKAVNTRGERVEAALQRADAAWFRGRLAVAMRWYNTVLEAVPDQADAWWGLAKIALAARGGHPGVDRAPWLANTPDRFTPQEALARLFMGLFQAPALTDFLARHPLGVGVAEAGATTVRLACAAVDLLVRYELVNGTLFDRLRSGYPAWARRIDLVQSLWTRGDPSFAISRSYRWSRPALERDFDVELTRSVIPRGQPVRGHLPVDFGTHEHWSLLIGSAQPEEPVSSPSSDTIIAPDGEGGDTVQFLVGDVVEFELDADLPLAEIGSAPGVAWRVDGLAPVHALMRRVGPFVYLERVGASELRVDGDEVPAWRIVGGETIHLGSYLWDVRRMDVPTPTEGPRFVHPEPQDDDLSEEGPEFEPEPEPEPDDADDERSAAAELVSDIPAGWVPDDAGEPTGEADKPSDVGDVDDGPVFFDASDIEERAPARADDRHEPDRASGGAGAAASPVMADEDPDDESTVGPDADDEPAPARRPATPAPAPARAPRTDRLAELEQLEVQAPNALGSDYDFDEEDTVVKTSPLLGAAMRLGSPGLDRPSMDEDSLGPAGDAPLPQWLAARGVQPPDDDPEVPAYFSESSRMDYLETDLPEGDEPPSEGFDDDPFKMPPRRSTLVPVSAPNRVAHVEIMSGPARGTQVAVQGVIALGRDESCEIYLPADPMLAPLHCRFVQTEDVFLVMDNGTERGTVVNGTRVSEAILSGGETVMVGSTVLRFQVQDA